MVEFHFKLLFFSGIIGIISIFTPVIFHISANFIYQFWLWGSVMYFGLNSNEIGIVYDTEIEFLIPAVIILILIMATSVLFLFTSLKPKKRLEIWARYYMIGGIVMIISPLFLIISWQIIYTLVRDYPTFWGVNYYWPSIAIFLQLIAGILALVLSLKIRIKIIN
ncbi:MAG: hypothetical protein ACFFCV_13605 [Promethearchaeota archaeon]